VLPQLAADATTQALRAGQLDRAGEMLRNYAQLTPGSADLARLRHALGTAWLDLANRDLARGDHAAARSALAQAQRWAPDDARVQALAQGLGGG
jgi:tetratricopeptide (TPR) repeat protein